MQGAGFSGENKEPGSIHRFFEYLGLVFFPMVILYILGSSGLALVNGNHWVLFTFAIALGLLGADMISGFVHWFCDTYGNENTPVLGKSIIRDFRMHHIYPKDITVHDFVYTNGNTFLFGLVFITPVILLLNAIETIPAKGFTFFTAITSFFGCAANMVHKWAHNAPEINSGLVRFLQKHHLVLNPGHHARHHKAPYDIHYNITFGWLNPLLDKFRFWDVLEGLFNFFGLKRDDSDTR